jgi:polar amino acid transport system substrate-binding protein
MLIILSNILAVSAKDESLLDNKQECSLTVGWGIWPPYQYLSENNQAKGVQINLLNRLAEEANCVLNYVQQPFSKNIADIQSGHIDMMADTTVTQQRQNFAYFSAPYRHEILLLYVKKEQVAHCKNRALSEIMNKQFRLGLTQGNLYGVEVEAIQQGKSYNNSIVYLKENRDALTYLLNDEIDGFFEDPIVLAYELKKRNLVGQIKSCRIEIYAGDVSLMFSRKTVKQEIVKRFDRALEKVKQSEDYKINWEW